MTNKQTIKKHRISITIDSEVFKQAQSACAKTGRKLSAWIEILLEKELAIKA